jgi:hypothetical protein
VGVEPLVQWAQQAQLVLKVLKEQLVLEVKKVIQVLQVYLVF